MTIDKKKFGNKTELTEGSCSYMIEFCTWTEEQGHKTDVWTLQIFKAALRKSTWNCLPAWGHMTVKKIKIGGREGYEEGKKEKWRGREHQIIDGGKEDKHFVSISSRFIVEESRKNWMV